MPPQPYQRDKTGVRLDLTGGMNTVLPPDLLVPPNGAGYAYLQNVRRNLQGRAVSRPPLGGNVLPGPVASPTSLVRMNDPYRTETSDPTRQYALIMGGSDGSLSVFNAAANSLSTPVTGLSTKPKSFVTFRPNASPQPWCYVADPAVLTANISNAAYPGPVSGMVKVRSDGLVYKTGIAEPQVAPTITSITPGGGPNWVMYRYVYRSSATGAVSNPSPECNPQQMGQTIIGPNTIYAAGPSSTLANIDYTSQWQFDTGTSTFRTASVSSGILLDYVIARNFNLNVPVGATVDGIEVALNWSGQNPGTGVLSSVSLFYQGSQLGQFKSPGIQNIAGTGSYGMGNTDTQGGGSDRWGTELTPAIVNDSTFGFGVQITTVQQGGTNRSFIYSFAITVYYTTPNNGVTATPSTDPQVDKIDFYRMDPGLSNFTYVGTGTNSTTVFSDTLSDLDVANNPILEFDNFEPFPSIDLPRKGTVNVVSSPTSADPGRTLINWASGDPFNTRWLPGTIILINQVAYTLYNRPSSTTQLIAVNTAVDPVTGYIVTAFPPAATGVAYEIAEPTLAAQPSPVIWGPTPDNAGAFKYGLDPLNLGDLLWSKGNNFDSAPDTNRMFVTTPSEPLMNGTVTSELSTVFSTERYWLIYPNFADALALTTGTAGQQWTLTQSQGTRGLYMRYAIDALGSLIAFRAKDCVAVTMGGQAEESITDSIYNLFPHGGQTPAGSLTTTPIPVTIAGQTVYPPDDTRPDKQTIKVTPGYIFYNFQDVTGIPRTLVYDLEAKGWSVDGYNPIVNCHLWPVGPTTRPVCGCVDGTVREIGGTGTPETGTSIIGTRSESGSDSRAPMRLGDMYIKALVTASSPVQVSLWRSRFTVPMAGYAPTTLTSTNMVPQPSPGVPGALNNYILDFTSGYGNDTDDVAVLFSWPLGSGNILDLWQPDWTELPEVTQDRPTDWDDGGNPGNKFIQGMYLECNTFGQQKTFQVEADDGSLHTPIECPFAQNGQAVRTFTFNPPFQAHMTRIISTDGVPWQTGPAAGWEMSIISSAAPESSQSYTTEASNFGLYGYIHCYQINLAYVAAQPVTVTLNTDQGVFHLTFPPGGTANAPAKILVKAPRNKWKICSFAVNSAGPVQIYKDLSEVWLKSWGSTGEYQKNCPFGGESPPSATI